MADPATFQYLNLEGRWPTFELQQVARDDLGGLALARDTTGQAGRGSFRGGPFVIRARPFEWQRLRVEAELPRPAAHVQLFTCTSILPEAPAFDAGPLGFDPEVWSAAPVDELDVLILGPTARKVLTVGAPADPLADQDPGAQADLYIWVAGILEGDGATSPVVRQMRLDTAPPAALDHLPAVYREGSQRPLLLGLLLALLSSELDRVQDQLTALPSLFDPAAAPPEWLPWLAGWLDFEPASGWSTADVRARLRQAIDLYAWRGTAEGMRRYLEVFVDVQARISEPAASIGLACLGETGLLGLDCRLAPEHAAGAILARTATLGQSSLLDATDAGAPLFTDVVHRFAVRVPAGQVAGPTTMDLIERLVEREKPAHTVAHVCVIQPLLRVGTQARIGIDSIVGGPLPEIRLDDPGERGLGVDSILASQQEGSSWPTA